MKSHKNQKNQQKLGSKPTKETIMGKSANTKYKWNRRIDTVKNKQTFNIIGDTVTLSLSDNIRFDLSNNWSNDRFLMDLDKETLKGLADFIYEYLENK
jgi:hypothetical protein